MNKPALFLDFDNLKFDTWPAHVAYINSRYKIRSVIADYAKNPWIDVVLGKYLPRDQIPTRNEIYEDLGTHFLTSHEHHLEVKPMEGMCEVVPLLAQKYSLWTVTARQKCGRSVVERLIELHIPNCIQGIHMVWERSQDKTVKGIPKRDFITSFPGEKVAFLDDSLSEILEVQEVIPSYLFDPLGINDNDTRVKNRVRSWREIGALFL